MMMSSYPVGWCQEVCVGSGSRDEKDALCLHWHVAVVDVPESLFVSVAVCTRTLCTRTLCTRTLCTRHIYSRVVVMEYVC